MKKIINKTFALIVTAALSISALTACGTYESGPETGNESAPAANAVSTDSAAPSDAASTQAQSTENGVKAINIAISSDPTFTFDAIGDSLMVTNGLLREGLTRYADGKLGDGLAESYEHNDDYTQWTFKLRDSGWSNGEPVTADDWVYAIGAMLDGTAQLSFADFLYEIKNARAIYTGEADVSTLGVTAVDDKTLVFDLEYPVTYFP